MSSQLAVAGNSQVGIHGAICAAVGRKSFSHSVFNAIQNWLVVDSSEHPLTHLAYVFFDLMVHRMSAQR